MSDTLILYCWILGGKTSNRAFPVPIDKKGDVGMLKRAIKLEKSVGLVYIDADALDLWHCSEPIPADGNLEQNVCDLGLTRNNPLPLRKKLSDIFFESPIQGNLHIVARAPNADSNARRLSDSGYPVAKRARLNPEYHLPGWLPDLHSALWNKPHMRDAIFREVELKFSDYLELERLLDAELSSHDSPPDRGFDVADLKRKFLNSISQPLPTTEGPSDGYEASSGMDEDAKVSGGEEERKGFDEAVQDKECGANASVGEDSVMHVDLEPLFPLKVRYADLTVLGMESCSAHIPSLIFIREEYTVINRVLASRGCGLVSSAVVTGQPGIGKTIYLYLRLIHRLLAGKQTYFQDLDGNIYFLSETISLVKGHGDIAHQGGDIEALVDGDLEVSRPRPLLSSSSDIRIILTSPPREDKKRSWLNHLGPGVGRTYIMDLWSPQEFIVAGVFFYPRDIHINRLMPSKKHFGLNPRLSWYASTSADNMASAKEDALWMVRQMPARMSLRALLVNATSGPNFEIAHTVFELQANDERRLFASARQKAVSEWVLDLVLTQYEADEPDAARLFYEYTKRSATTASLSGVIWERQAHRISESPGGLLFPIVLS